MPLHILSALVTLLPFALVLVACTTATSRYSMGFKGDLTTGMANTIAIAQRQWEWCNDRDLSLGALALQVQCMPWIA